MSVVSDFQKIFQDTCAEMPCELEEVPLPILEELAKIWESLGNLVKKNAEFHLAIPQEQMEGILWSFFVTDSPIISTAACYYLSALTHSLAWQKGCKEHSHGSSACSLSAVVVSQVDQALKGFPLCGILQKILKVLGPEDAFVRDKLVFCKRDQKVIACFLTMRKLRDKAYSLFEEHLDDGYNRGRESVVNERNKLLRETLRIERFFSGKALDDSHTEVLEISGKSASSQTE